MVSDDDAALDVAFLALADPVRRRIIARLSRGPATVNDLAEPFEISKQAVSKHIQVLEQAQLVTRSRDAQRRPVHLNPARLEALTAWIDQYRLVREGQFRSLDAVLESSAANGAKGKGQEMTNQLKITAPEALPYIDFEREFDFPVADVFRAHKDPELVAQWLGPRGMKMEMDHYDFRTGGSYRYIHTGPEGVPYEFRGIFHTVRENEFALQTFEFGGYPDSVSLESMTFEELDGGRCRLRGHAMYPSMEARDGMLHSGMEGGMSEGYERLDELLAGASV